MITKCYSTDNEWFIYVKSGELFAAMDAEGDLVEGQVYYEADCKVCEPKDYATENAVCWFLEDLDTRLYDDVGEYSDGDFSNVNKEAKEELRSLLETWVTKHVNVGNFWKIIGNSRECVVTKDDLL